MNLNELVEPKTMLDFLNEAAREYGYIDANAALRLNFNHLKNCEHRAKMRYGEYIRQMERAPLFAMPEKVPVMTESLQGHISALTQSMILAIRNFHEKTGGHLQLSVSIDNIYRPMGKGKIHVDPIIKTSVKIEP